MYIFLFNLFVLRSELSIIENLASARCLTLVQDLVGDCALQNENLIIFKI